MERSGAISEFSASREAPVYDHGLLSRYGAPSVSCYNPQTPFDRQPIDLHPGHFPDHPSRGPFKESAGDAASGGYSYSSSYDDMNRRYGHGYGYGLSRESQVPEAYKGGAFDGPSAYLQDYPHRPSPSPYVSAYSKDVGHAFGSQRHAYGGDEWGSGRRDDNVATRGKDFDDSSDPLELPTGGRLQNPDYEYGYLLKNYNVQHEQPMSMDYVSGSMTGPMRDDGRSYLAANRYDALTSGSSLSYPGALYEREGAGDIVTESGGLGSSSFGSFQSILQKQDPFDRVGNTSRFMDSRFYSQDRDYSSLSAWNGESAKQIKLDAGSKERETPSLLVNEPVIDSSKQMTATEASDMPIQDARSPKSADAGKKRRSRWEPVEETEKSSEDGNRKPKKKTRWSAEKSPTKESSLPDIMKEISVENADDVALRARLMIITRMLQSGQVLIDNDGERSPSPEPVLDNLGFRVNTRENRAREKLNDEKQRIMARLSAKSKDSKSAHAKSFKFSKKIYIPVDKHPDYNFIGLIIGPRGHTQKQMEEESGARIFIRGRGSAREGSAVSHALSTDSEELHVLVEADSEDAINKASEMIQKILVPVEDGQNKLKKAQLRELASLNGTLRLNEVCFECKRVGHLAKDCPLLGLTTSNFNLLNDTLKAGDIAAPFVAGILGHEDSDNSHLVVSKLPLHVDDAQLLNLFLPFGKLVSAKVVYHPATGMSLGNGFVEFFDAADAGQAAALMNGYQLDGNVLVVRVKTNSEPGI